VLLYVWLPTKVAVVRCNKSQTILKYSKTIYAFDNCSPFVLAVQRWRYN